jgi:hypothetical protein
MGEKIGDVVELVGVNAALFIRDALGCDPVVCGVERAVATDGPWKELEGIV